MTEEQEKELRECIEKATPHWEGTDVDKYLNDVRGVPYWHDATGDDLPPINEEVIALTDAIGGGDHGLYRICFAHRPDPNGWSGKSMTTGKVGHYEAMTYDKCGWNLPNIRWWMPCPKIPNSD